MKVRCKVIETVYRQVYFDPMEPIEGLPPGGRIVLTLEGKGLAQQYQRGELYDLTVEKAQAPK